MNILKSLGAKKKAAEAFLQGVGGKIAGRSTVDNTTNPFSASSRQKQTYKATQVTQSFKKYLDRGGKP